MEKKIFEIDLRFQSFYKSFYLEVLFLVVQICLVKSNLYRCAKSILNCDSRTRLDIISPWNGSK